MAASREAPQPDDAPLSPEELERALCVLAGSDADNCSYARGYVKRQAVFACNTCTAGPAAEPAGVCLACADKCHSDHDLIELYTKRNFRCDCGNKKFGDFQCKLNPAKDETNDRNRYDHNFHGCYCTCDRPYPDAEDQEDDEMIQCVVCEDWFHGRHLGCAMEEPEELQELVCEACMNKAPFLWTYAAHFAVPPVVNVSRSGQEGEEEEEVDVEDGGGASGRRDDEEPSTSGEQGEQQEAAASRGSPAKRTHREMTEGPGGKAKAKTAECRLKELQQAAGPERPRRGAVFWPYSWRSELCTCTGCKRTYVAADVSFLMDQSDTILAYERRGQAEPFGQHPLIALTSSMDRAQQLEVIYGFNELTTSISAFLEQCVSEGKTVTVEAVQQFFEELRARKRRRTNAGYQ